MFRNRPAALLTFASALLGLTFGLQAQFSPAPYPAQYPQTSDPQGSYAPQAASQYPQGAYPPANGAPYPSNSQTGLDAPDPASDQQHGVARISVAQGDVNVKRGDSGQLVAAAMNAPLVALDDLQTSAGSRAEVELDSGNLVRVAPDTDIRLADLEYRRYQIQLGAGTIIYRVLRNSSAQAEIDTPSIAVRPTTEGEYRISVLEDGTTQITVRSGEVEIFSPRGSQREGAGHSTLVRGNASDPEFQNTYEIGRDQFDDWSVGRDRDLLQSQSYGRVNPDVYGADDLDRYGNWVPSQYGDVWAPQTAGTDWSPYSNGYWSWVNYYGWTWVDYAPWGWAPYHYGRWFWNGGHGWCWWPGPRVGFQLWSPALVGFFGWGSGLGWVALAPFESIHAWWGHGWRGGYGNSFYGRGGFGFAGGFNVLGAYRNAAFRGGAMTAPFDHFGGPGARFSAASRVQLTNASLVRGPVPVGPTRNSFLFSGRQAVANPRLSSVGGRQFFSTQPRYAGAGNRAQGGWQSAGRGATQNYTAGSRASYATQQRSSGTNGGWQRFGDPGAGGSTTYRQGFVGGGQERSGWHAFGQPQQTSPARVYGSGSYTGGRSYGSENRYSAPQQRYSAPPQQHYSSPPQQHYSAPPQQHYSGGSPGTGNRGGGSGDHGSRGGGGGGQEHSSGGHRGR